MTIYEKALNSALRCTIAEAARLMGYEVVEDVPTTVPTTAPTTIEEKQVVSSKEANMNKRKPIKDWTLAEVQAYCNGRKCTDCVLKTSICLISPDEWEFSDRPRFTPEEIADAKALVRLFGEGTWTTVERHENGAMILSRIERGVRYSEYCLDPEAFPSIPPGESATLKEIIESEGKT